MVDDAYQQVGAILFSETAGACNAGLVVFPAPPNVPSKAPPSFWDKALPDVSGAAVMVPDVPPRFYECWAGWALTTIACLPRQVHPLSDESGSVSAAAELLEFSPLLGLAATLHRPHRVVGLPGRRISPGVLAAHGRAWRRPALPLR